MDLAALSLPGGMLTAPLGAVPPSMTLLEALQTRQAQDVLSALEAARAPSRHPLDISLQAKILPHSLREPSSACYAARAWVARQQSTSQGRSLIPPWRPQVASMHGAALACQKFMISIQTCVQPSAGKGQAGECGDHPVCNRQAALALQLTPRGRAGLCPQILCQRHAGGVLPAVLHSISLRSRMRSTDICCPEGRSLDGVIPYAMDML